MTCLTIAAKSRFSRRRAGNWPRGRRTTSISAKRFKALGGKWNEPSRVWVFDQRDEARVRAVVEDVFGSLESSGRLVTVRWQVSDRYNPARLAGRVIAERRGRDEDVRLGAGVVIVSGEFPSRGGSRNNPALGSSSVIVEIRDVDANIAAKDHSGRRGDRQLVHTAGR